jgi:hypothetical protein
MISNRLDDPNTTLKNIIAFFLLNNTQWTETDGTKTYGRLKIIHFSKPVPVFVNYLKCVFEEGIGQVGNSRSSPTLFPVNTGFNCLGPTNMPFHHP